MYCCVCNVLLFGFTFRNVINRSYNLYWLFAQLHVAIFFILTNACVWLCCFTVVLPNQYYICTKAFVLLVSVFASACQCIPVSIALHLEVQSLLIIKLSVLHVALIYEWVLSFPKCLLVDLSSFFFSFTRRMCKAQWVHFYGE